MPKNLQAYLMEVPNLCRTRLCDDDDGEMRSRSQSRAEREGERDGQFFCGSSPTNSHVAHSLSYVTNEKGREGGQVGWAPHLIAVCAV